MPKYAVVMLFFTMANVGLPGTSGFVGEFLTMLAAFQVNSWVALLATLGTILSAAYALYLYRRVVFGKLDKASLRSILDLSGREVAILAPPAGADALLRRPPAADPRRLAGDRRRHDEDYQRPRPPHAAPIKAASAAALSR